MDARGITALVITYHAPAALLALVATSIALLVVLWTTRKSSGGVRASAGLGAALVVFVASYAVAAGVADVTAFDLEFISLR
jgi:hypothetical protein